MTNTSPAFKIPPAAMKRKTFQDRMIAAVMPGFPAKSGAEFWSKFLAENRALRRRHSSHPLTLTKQALKEILLVAFREGQSAK